MNSSQRVSSRLTAAFFGVAAIAVLGIGTHVGLDSVYSRHSPK